MKRQPQFPHPTQARVVFFGTPRFAADTLRTLAKNGYEVVAVVTQPDRPSGRHGRAQASAVSTVAETLGVPLLKPQRKAELVDLLKSVTADVGVLFAYGAIISETVLQQFPHGIVNIHPSLLPNHRGPSPVPAAILSGDPITGVTLIQLDAEVDHGPILARQPLTIEPHETSDQLHDRLASLGTTMLLDTLPQWLAGTLTAQPQDHSQASMTKVLQRDDGKIDWSQPVEVIYRSYRALHPWPGSFTHLQGQRLKLLAVRPASGSTQSDQPGKVRRQNGSVEVACGDGYLLLEQVQLEGRRPTSAVDLVNGHPAMLGSLLG